MIRFLRRARRLLWRNTGTIGQGPRGECLEYYNGEEPNFEATRRKYDRINKKFLRKPRARERLK